jgi:hypothetical protein
MNNKRKKKKKKSASPQQSLLEASVGRIAPVGILTTC